MRALTVYCIRYSENVKNNITGCADLSFTIDETWTDAEGNRLYKTHGTWFEPPAGERGPHYSLNRINAAGTVREWVWSIVAYPEELSPIGGTYCIYCLQK